MADTMKKPGFAPEGAPNMPPQGAPGGPEGAQPTGKYSRGRLNTPQRGHGGGPGGRGGRMVTKPKDTKKTIARLVTYVTHDKLKIAFIFFLVILSSVTRVGATYITRPIVNTLTMLRDDPMLRVKQLAGYLVLLLAVHLFSTACSYFQEITMARLAHRGAHKLRGELFEKLQQLPLSYFDAHTHGELMSRFTNDADSVQMCLEQTVINLISSLMTFISVIAMMFVTGWKLFPVTALTIFATMYVVSKRGKKSQVLFRKQHAALGEMNGNIQEMIEGLKVVKAFTHEDEANAEFAELNENYFQVSKDANYYGQSIMPFTGNIGNIGYAVTAMVGGCLVATTGYDVGALVTYLNYSRQVSQPINQMSQQVNTILSALAGAERIFAIMDMEPEIDEGKVTMVNVEERDGELHEVEQRTGSWAWKVPQEDGSAALVPVRGDVHLNNVVFSYVPGVPILKGVSFYAKPGQKLAFVGSTGAGKTTISNLINRFYEIDSGEISYDGINITDIRKDDLRRATAMVLQDTHLFTGTVMDNIRYGRLDATDEECIAAAKTANAHSFIRRLPDGYQTMVTGDGANLSQGQRQLLAIARAAVAAPPVLVLDEATSSIDTRTERLIEKGLDGLMAGRTVFVIAHRLSTVRNSNCIVVIEHGEIQEKGDHAELLDFHGRYYMLYTGQLILD